jgi:predicted ATPase
LRNFKGFEDFTVSFGDFAVLVGPNNAGKSTVIEGLRASARMLRWASRRHGQEMREHRKGLFAAHPLSSESILIQSENLRHEFRDTETWLELRLAGQHALRAVWPSEDSGDSPFFYVAGKDDMPIKQLRHIRDNFPAPYVIPVLGPIETYEPLLTEDHVLQSRMTHLATRHFRNNLLILSTISESDGSTRLDTFYRFAHDWLPAGIELEHPTTRSADKGIEIDLFYREGRVPKELAWAGDGIQAFLQVLLHVFLADEAQTIVLDEPDVLLHPDLQRRVIRLLESMDRQVILATHSPEMVLESPPHAVTWIDRTRKRAVRAPEAAVLDDLRQALGSGVSLRLAQVLRREAVVIVEGDDIKILRILGRIVGRNRLTTESSGLGLLKLEGLDNWPKLEGFSWLADELLEGAVQALVILDRDVRSDSEVSGMKRSLTKAGLSSHVWRSHEIENYLLQPTALARSTGLTETEIGDLLDEACEALKSDTIGLGVKYWSRQGSKKGIDVKDTTVEVVNRVERSWTTRDDRMRLVSGKDLLRYLNKALQVLGLANLTAMGLASRLLPDEIDREIVGVLDMVEEL